jgi:glycosyltransferase involved in cell wall biosynthesis
MLELESDTAQEPATAPGVRPGPRRAASICFVSPNLYGQLSGRADVGFIGGAEVQLTLIARGLAARGAAVSVVTWDHGQPDGEEHHCVRVWKTCPRHAGIPVLRFVFPRLTSLWRAMRRADAAVYVHRTADSDTGLVAAWARRHRRKFFFSVASDTDCLRDLPRLPTRRQRTLFRYGLRSADCVLAQTERQRRLLREQFGIEARLVPPCAPDPGPESAEPAEGPPRVLWVGRFSAVKRLELCLDVARACPELLFDVVGESNVGGDYEQRLRAEAAQLGNVRLHGRVPHERVGAFYRRALALLCTSQWEGFPNTFLEAWSRGVPTVSTVEPDGVISAHELGAVASDASGLAAALRGLARNEGRRNACGGRARAHFEGRHRVASAVSAYEGLLEEFA